MVMISVAVSAMITILLIWASKVSMARGGEYCGNAHQDPFEIDAEHERSTPMATMRQASR